MRLRPHDRGSALAHGAVHAAEPVVGGLRSPPTRRARTVPAALTGAPRSTQAGGGRPGSRASSARRSTRARRTGPSRGRHRSRRARRPRARGRAARRPRAPSTARGRAPPTKREQHPETEHAARPAGSAPRDRSANFATGARQPKRRIDDAFRSTVRATMLARRTNCAIAYLACDSLVQRARGPCPGRATTPSSERRDDTPTFQSRNRATRNRACSTPANVDC